MTVSRFKRSMYETTSKYLYQKLLVVVHRTLVLLSVCEVKNLSGLISFHVRIVFMPDWGNPISHPSEKIHFYPMISDCNLDNSIPKKLVWKKVSREKDQWKKNNALMHIHHNFYTTKGRDRFHWAATPLKPYKVGNICYMTYRYSV